MILVIIVFIRFGIKGVCLLPSSPIFTTEKKGHSESTVLSKNSWKSILVSIHFGADNRGQKLFQTLKTLINLIVYIYKLSCVSFTLFSEKDFCSINIRVLTLKYVLL